jgi:hypothetical protein
MTEPRDRSTDPLLLEKTFRFQGCLAKGELRMGNPYGGSLQSTDPALTHMWKLRSLTWRQNSCSTSGADGELPLNHICMVLRAMRKNVVRGIDRPWKKGIKPCLWLNCKRIYRNLNSKPAPLLQFWCKITGSFSSSLTSTQTHTVPVKSVRAPGGKDHFYGCLRW